MDEQPDRELGTAAYILHRRGHLRAASLLLAVQDLKYNHWDERDYGAQLTVDFSLLDEFDDVTKKLICSALDEANRQAGDNIVAVGVVPALVGGDWRSDLQAALSGKHVSNQAKLVRLPERHPTMDRMDFRDMSELRVYQALKRKQESLPKDDTIAIVPNPAVRLPGHTWEPDFLVTYKKRCGAVEVDGGSHRKKYASDKSRDVLFEDAGVVRVERVDVAEAEDAGELDRRIDKFLRRLAES